MSDAATARLALGCLDLTSLNAADGETEVARLCERAQGRFGDVAAVCVWPRLAGFARRRLPPHIAVAAVANFPAGATDVVAAQREAQQLVDSGADEIDLVLPWRALLAGDDAAARALLLAVRAACPALRLKVILETGELRDDAWVDRAARLALACGADFLKTSTGKTPVGASLSAARVMARAIADDAQTRLRVGLKVSGGLRCIADVRPYLELWRDLLGADALQAQRFRIGASTLLDDIERVLCSTATTSDGGFT